MKFPKLVIFLDIDGCLTSKRDNTYFNPNPNKYHPSKNIIDLLETFCLANDIKIIISSNWRKFDENASWTNGYGTYKNPIKEVKDLLSNVYFCTLPKFRHMKKSTAISKWLDENPGCTMQSKFAIIDDDLDEGFLDTLEYDISNRFVHINSKYGITENDLEKVLEILENE